MKDLSNLINSKKLFIFDFDGTLADTSPYHAEAFRQSLKGSNLKFDYQDIAGMDSRSAINFILAKSNTAIKEEEILLIIKEKQRIVRDLISKNLEMMPGVELFLDWAYKKLNGKMCIVSSGSRDSINLSVEKLGIASYFKFLICSEDVSESKPSPEGFLLAIKYAGVSRDEALIFEDSDTGIEAAHRAKIKHFKVNRHFWDNIKLAL